MIKIKTKHGHNSPLVLEIDTDDTGSQLKLSDIESGAEIVIFGDELQNLIISLMQLGIELEKVS